MMEDEQTEQAGGEAVPGPAWSHRGVQDPAAEAAETGPAPVRVAAFAGPLSTEQVVEIARAVVRDLEPEELPVFNGVADAWLRDDLKRGRLVKAPGASVGFGVEAVLLSQLVFPIIAAAVGEVLGGITEDRLQARWQRSARRGDAKEVTPAATVTARAGENAARGEANRQQALALHDACQRHARTLGMSPARAALLADAVVGSLTTSRGGE
jgi:hypothetical protein